MNDSIDGRDRAPDRFSGHGRETIDRMRDRCYAEILRDDRFDVFVDTDEKARALADLLFEVHCSLTAMKYVDRAGLKDDAASDWGKAGWYRQMADHVRSRGRVPDPRCHRPGFKPYVRKEFEP